jgi:hypothetical protein
MAVISLKRLSLKRFFRGHAQGLSVYILRIHWQQPWKTGMLLFFNQ